MWFKVVQLLKRYRLVVCLFLGLNILVAIGIFYYPRYRLMVWQKKLLQPFVADAKTSLGEETPEATYHAFWQALQSGQKETALSLIIGLRRPYYQTAWQTDAYWQLDSSLPEEVDLLFQDDCLPEAIACKQQAVLSYKKADSSDQKDNNSEQKDGGDGRIELYQNLAGRWQIGDIY
ncbi:MAG TPA: hypothetical protein PKN62_02995 [bacterium]|nr:hypothetical protein [bacterium]